MSTPIQVDLSGKTAIVTGANTGLGKVIAKELARMGADVTLACRNAERGEAALKEILAAHPKAHAHVQLLDVASQASVADFANKYMAQHPKLDILVNNAGGWWFDHKLSPEGIELQWATNVLGPQQLTLALLPALKASPAARIVNMASTAAGGLDLSDPLYTRRKFDGFKAYSTHKQANRMLTWAMADRLKGTSVTVNALSPGLVKTEFNRNVKGGLKFFFAIMMPIMGRTPEQGADTAVWLAASPEVQGRTNEFWIDRKPVPCKFRNTEQQELLWKACDEQLSRKAAAA